MRDPDPATTAGASWPPSCRHCGHEAGHHYTGFHGEGCHIGGCDCRGFGAPLPAVADPDPAATACEAHQSRTDHEREVLAAYEQGREVERQRTLARLATFREVHRCGVIEYPIEHIAWSNVLAALGPAADLLDGDGDER